MDESLQELEAELKALRPRRPGDHLFAQVEQDLGAPKPAAGPAERSHYVTATNLDSWKWRDWRTAGVAATVALVAAWVLWQRPDRLAPATASSTVAVNPPARIVRPADGRDRYEPVAATNVLYDLQDDGLVKIGDQRARQVVVRYLDTYTWKNPATNASLKWSVPRDEVRVLPATFN